MWNKLAVWLTSYSLTRSDLSLEQRNKIVNHIMASLHALPINGIITTNENGEMLISGRLLNIERAKQLKESARAVLDNQAFKVVNQEVLYVSVVGGLHKSTRPEDLYFYKTAIWFGQQLESQLKILAQE